jgi:hypothetical protein
MLFNKELNYSLLKILGCLCFSLTRPYNKHKLELRSQPYIFIGYAISQKGYRCLNLSSNKKIISRNVQFDENNFPFKDSPISSHDQPIQPSLSAPLTIIQNKPILPSIPSRPNISTLPSAHTETNVTAQTSLTYLQPSSNGPQNSNNPTSPTPVLTIEPSSISQTPSIHPFSNSNNHPMVTRTKDKSRRQREFPDFMVDHAHTDLEPTSFPTTNKLIHWREAMATEHALARNNT